MKSEATSVRCGPMLLPLALGQGSALLPVLGLTIACGLLLFSGLPIPIRKPWILALGACLLCVRADTPRLAVLQQILGLYLVALVFNELHLQYVSFSLLATQVTVSQAVGPLLLCVVGYYLGRNRAQDSGSSSCVYFPGLVYGCVGAGVLLAAHMGVVGWLLQRCYGHGYEHDAGALGHLAMYVLLLLVLRRGLAEQWVRSAMGMILAVFYVLSSLR